MDKPDTTQDVIPFIFDLKQRRALNKESRARAYEDFLYSKFEELFFDHEELVSVPKQDHEALFIIYKKIEVRTPGDVWDEIDCTVGSVTSGWSMEIIVSGMTTAYITPIALDSFSFDEVFYTPVRLGKSYERVNESLTLFEIGYLDLIHLFLTSERLKDLREESEEGRYIKVLKVFLKNVVRHFVESTIEDVVKSYWLELNMNDLKEYLGDETVDEVGELAERSDEEDITGYTYYIDPTTLKNMERILVNLIDRVIDEEMS